MSQPVIQVRGLGKRYCLGGQARLDQTIPEAISATVRRAIGMVRRPQWRAKPDDQQEFWALRGVSFDVNEGEVIGIIGSNGAGKSTLLKILSQITEPSEGQATVHGRVASLLEVGTGFHPELTGRENIYLNGSILGMSRREIKTKFDEIVAFSGVERFLDTPIKRYSSGMTMRLAFSVAAHLEPEILVIDEVLAVGDASFQKKCLGKMDEVARNGRTVLFVSHNMSAVARLCDRAVLLDRGRVKCVGDVQDIVGRYYQNVGQNANVPRVDLSDHPHEHGNHDLEVLSLELLNPIAETFAIPWDQPIKLKLRVRVNHPVQDVTFGVGCRTVDQVPLFTVHSTDQYTERIDLTRTGVTELCVSIRHNLNAGLYVLLVGVSSRQRNYYYNEAAAQMEVVGIGEQEYHGKQSGLIHCQSQWSIEHASAQPCPNLNVLTGDRNASHAA